MEKTNESVSMISMFPYPVFSVRDGVIAEVNQFAAQRQICAGTPIAQLLEDQLPEYQAFHSGCLSLTVHAAGAEHIATVMKTEDADVFHLCDEHVNERLCAMALTVQQMRQPLSDIMTAADALMSDVTGRNPSSSAHLKQSLHQLQRLANNISAANSYARGRTYGMENCNVTALLTELLSHAEELVKTANRSLVYRCPKESVYCPVDEDMLEKAVYNLISNAIKGSPAGSTIEVDVASAGNKLRLRIQNTDNGLGCGTENLFFRYLRAPQVEDGRHGIGLGIPIVQLVAAAHGGTLLMDHPEKETIRFTLTLSTIAKPGDLVRSPVVQIDHFGGFDHGLVELADVLPASAFENF